MLRHAIEARHDSFLRPEFVALAREYGVAIVVAGDSEYPLIDDPTAPFVYSRIMGTQPKEELGYSDAALTRWAARAKAWVSGAAPVGMDLVEPQGATDEPRDVYLYVISGAKARNPAAAMALISKSQAPASRRARPDASSARGAGAPAGRSPASRPRGRGIA